MSVSEMDGPRHELQPEAGQQRWIARGLWLLVVVLVCARVFFGPLPA